MKKFILLCLLISSTLLFGQSRTKRALFLGNSYTYSNNMPQIVQLIALSVGDSLEYDLEAPGGTTLAYHYTSGTTRQKLELGNWDYVTLQDQSLRPAWEIYSYAAGSLVDSLCKELNPCTTVLFYMTWGRKNGSSWTTSWPYTGTYLGMDSVLQSRYRIMAQMNNSEVSPVGAVWRYIREHYPDIELYQPDESHPSFLGSYAVGMCFYTSIFRKDPTPVTKNYMIPDSTAAKIKLAVKLVVYDSLAKWGIGQYDYLKNDSCDNKTSLSEHDLDNIKIFPNPVKDILKLDMDSQSHQGLEIYNLLGVKIREYEASEIKEYDLSDLKTGYYFIRLKAHPEKSLKFRKE